MYEQGEKICGETKLNEQDLCREYKQTMVSIKASANSYSTKVFFLVVASPMIVNS